MKFETRSLTATVEDVDDGKRTFWARVMNYGQLDDHGTKFRQGAFNESLSQRMPRLMWGHSGWVDLRQLMGKGIEYREMGTEGLDVHFQLAKTRSAEDFWELLKDGVIDQFSVGFMRQAETPPKKGERGTWIEKARLGEVSGVVEGSVPGTKLLEMSGRSLISTDTRVHERLTVSTRSMIDADVAASIMARLNLGQLDLADALAEVKAHAQVEEAEPSEDDPADEEPEDDEEPSEAEPPAEQPAPEAEPVPEPVAAVLDPEAQAAALAEAEAALAGL